MAVKEFFEYLAQVGLTEDRLEQTLSGWRSSQLTAFLARYAETFPPFIADGAQPQFSFIANTGLSGGPFPCRRAECRLTRADALGRFAALYADKVLIRDPLELFVHLQDHVDAEMLPNLADSLRVLYLLRPLLEAELIDLASGTLRVCPNCYRNLLAENGIAPERFDRAKDALSDRFVREVSVVIRRLAHGAYLEMRGPEALIEHGSGAWGPLDPGELLAKKKSGAKLSTAEMRKTRALSSFVRSIVDDIALENLFSHRYGVAYLTDREIDFEVLKAVNRPADNRLNHALVSGLAHTLPVVHEVGFQDLLKLRQEEGARRSACTGTRYEAFSRT